MKKECTPEARIAYRDAILGHVDNTLGKDAREKKGGALYGFHLRTPNWSHPENGFFVLEDCHPCLIVHRSAHLRLAEGVYDVRTNVGPDGPNYVNLVFVDEDASSGQPSAAFLERLLEIIRSARPD